ncbi:MAG: hypothetical protein AB2A00_17195 [Myxococcota bacterium]
MRGLLLLCVPLVACDAFAPVLGTARCDLPGAEGCVSTDPIPDEQNALMRWLWANYDGATDAQLHEAITRLHRLFDGDNLTRNVSGTLDDLTSSDLNTVNMSNRDPGPATGLLLVDALDCTVEHLDRITTYDNQIELYPGVYDSYERTYLQSKDDYLARRSPLVSWNLATTGTLLQSAYRMKYAGGNRLIPAAEGSAAIGPILFTRSFLREPADFDDDTRAMDQDWQVEVYYERAPGKVIHLWGDWRQVKMGSLTNDDEVVLEVMLSNMEDWDEQTRQLCADGKPAAQ